MNKNDFAALKRKIKAELLEFDATADIEQHGAEEADYLDAGDATESLPPPVFVPPRASATRLGGGPRKLPPETMIQNLETSFTHIRAENEVLAEAMKELQEDNLQMKGTLEQILRELGLEGVGF